ncbi:hypothetical protein FHX52_1945 [Humibacillus xanthopallidus]|uniref:Ig-like domain-containing protein n=1 Tax=Humibacillus xanthopallidus TaxID=412689 RepID=A0A543PXI9_9MICO|nr:hypothetical protein [Humibacillus xanthopallidus]TQN48798.1 hypothetical protein FHX52_1945 [Humibacillus xanthopallidus]
MEHISETSETNERPSVARRRVLKAGAWSVPAVAIVGSTPAFAATGDAIAITSVVVSPQAVGALIPTRYINIGNAPTATVTVSGTATAGVQVYVKTGSYTSSNVTASGGTWSVVIPSSVVAGWSDGVHTFTATVASGNKPSVTATQTVIKDTVRPTVLATQATISTNNQTGTISGTKSEAGTVVVSVAGLTMGTYSYASATQWSVTWSGGSNQAYTGSVAVTDDAGNSGVADGFGWPKGATSPVAL